MIVSELVATLGVKISRGEFADAALAIEGLGRIAEKVFGAIEKGISKAFEAVNTVGDQADALSRLSETLGVSAEALQSLGGAAALAADVPFDTFAAGMGKLTIASAKAAEGAQEAIDAFGKVSLKGANGQLKSSDQLMLDLADDFQKIQNPAEKLNRSMTLFGREGGKQFVAFLNKGSAAIRSLQETYSESGAAITQEQIEAAEKLSTSNHLLEFSMKGLTNSFANPKAIEALAGLKEALAKLAMSKGVHLILDKLGTSFARVMDEMEGFVNLVTEWLGEGDHLARVLDIATAALGVLGVAMGVLAAESLVTAALTFGPWILAAGLLVLAFDDIKHFVEGKDSMLGRLLDWAHDTSDPEQSFFIKFIKGIIDGVATLIRSVPKAIDYLKELISFGDGAKDGVSKAAGHDRQFPGQVGRTDPGESIDEAARRLGGRFFTPEQFDAAARYGSAFRGFEGQAFQTDPIANNLPPMWNMPPQTNVNIHINGTGLNEEQVVQAVRQEFVTQVDQAAKGLGQ